MVIRAADLMEVTAVNMEDPIQALSTEVAMDHKEVMVVTKVVDPMEVTVNTAVGLTEVSKVADHMVMVVTKVVAHMEVMVVNIMADPMEVMAVPTEDMADTTDMIPRPVIFVRFMYNKWL